MGEGRSMKYLALVYLVGVYGLLLLGVWWCFELLLSELYQDALHAGFLLALVLWTWRDAYRFISERTGEDHDID